MKMQMPTALITIIDDFLNALKRQGLQATTIKRRREALNRFMSYLNGTEMNRFQDVTVQAVENYQAYLRGENLSENTIGSYLYATRGFFDYLEREQLIFENPTRLIAFYRRSKRLPTILTVSDIQNVKS